MAEFREVFAAFGVDGALKSPAMMVPLHGSNVVALVGGADLTVLPEKDIVKVEKLDKGQVAQYMAAAEHLSATARGTRPLGVDAVFYKVSGNKIGGLKGTLLNAANAKSPGKVEASLRAVVLAERLIKVAIRVVKARNDKGDWEPLGKIPFDAQDLLDQMNAIWLPQSNVRFKLVSKDPFLIDEKELAAELARTKVGKAAFLDEVHIEAFDPLFRRNKVKDADFTIFLVKSILRRDLAHPNLRGDQPAGATPDGSGFCLVCDRMALDLVRESRHIATIPGIVPAHEAGHFMGLDNHVTDQTGEMLMVEGGPTSGFGKVTVDQTTRVFNTKY